MNSLIGAVLVIIVLIVLYRRFTTDGFRVKLGSLSLGSYDPSLYSSDITRNV
jgi:hypothetical protein